MAQIGTVKVETAGGPVELPVYELGDSGSNRVEAFRVQTASGPGFVPLTEVSAADRPYLRVQTGNGVKAFDTSASGIPDSAVSRWTFDDSDTSGGVLTDIWGDNDATNNGADTGVSGANQTYTTNEAYHVDGSDSKVVDCGVISEVHGSNALTLAAWIRRDTWDSLFNSVIATHVDNTDGWGFISNDSDGIRFRMENGGTLASSLSTTISQDEWYHVVGVFDDDHSVLYVDGSEAAGRNQTNGISVPSVDDPFKLGNDEFDASRPKPVDVDDVRIYDKALSDSEVSDLYNNGSI